MSLWRHSWNLCLRQREKESINPLWWFNSACLGPTDARDLRINISTELRSAEVMLRAKMQPVGVSV